MPRPERPTWRRPVAITLAGVLLAVLGTVWIGPVAGVTVSAVIAATLLVITTRCGPVTLLSLYVTLLVVVPARFVVGPLGAVGTPAVLLGLVALWWWFTSHFILGESHAPGFQPMRAMVLGFLGVTLLTYGVGFLRPLDGVQMRSADRSLIAYAAMAGIALLALDGIESRERLEVLLRRVVLAVVFMGLVGIVQFSTGYDPSETLRPPGLRLNGELYAIAENFVVRRVSGTALHAIEFGVVLAMVLPIALYNALEAPPGRRAARWACLLVIGTAIPMSVSRSAVVGLAVAMLVILPAWSWPRRVKAMGAMVVFAVGIRAAVPGLLGTIKNLFLEAPRDSSILARTDDYDSVFEVFWDAPWLGGGLGTFLPESFRYLDNQYLGTMLEMGAVGLVTLLLLFVVGMSVSRGARRRAVRAEDRHLGQALAASVAAAAVTSATFDGLSFPIYAGMLFLVLGCAGTLWRFTTTPESAGSVTPVPAEVAIVKSPHRTATLVAR